MMISIHFRNALAQSITAAGALLLISCHNNASTDAIATVGNASLSRSKVENAVPHGLSSQDSTRFAHAYIRNWIDDRILEVYAADELPDMDMIDKLTEEYRRQLIIQEYRRLLTNERIDADYPEDTIRAAYASMKHQLRTPAPLVRGLLLKLPDASPSVAEARRLYRSDRQKDIDRLEQLPDAMDYEYFRDRWMEWSSVAARVPADYGSEQESWPVTHRHLDFSTGGFNYMLSITECLPEGSIMPYEVARPYVLEKLLADSRVDFDRKLRRELYDKGMNDGKIVLF